LSEFSVDHNFIYELEDIIFKTDLEYNKIIMSIIKPTRFNSVWAFTLEAVLDAIESTDALKI